VGFFTAKQFTTIFPFYGGGKKKKQLALALWFAEVRWGSAAYAEVAV
jgi:hypothetical protein